MEKRCQLIVMDNYDRIMLLKQPGGYKWSATCTFSNVKSPYNDMRDNVEMLFHKPPKDIGTLMYEDMVYAGCFNYIIYGLIIEKNNPLQIKFDYDIRMLCASEIISDMLTNHYQYSTETILLFRTLKERGIKDGLCSKFTKEI